MNTTTLKPAMVAALLLATAMQAAADEIVKLVCTFQHGELLIDVNYTRETVNGATAMITDKEIVWSPPGEADSMAMINRYSGLIQISKGRSEFLGMCNRATGK
jgi:heat shock protein HslJ